MIRLFSNPPSFVALPHAYVKELLEETQTTLDKALSSKEHHEDLSCNTIRTSLNSRSFALSSTRK